MEVVKRQKGRNIPFYWTISKKEYLEMKRADGEIEKAEHQKRHNNRIKQKESRAQAGTRNAASKNILSTY